ncbi:MAG: Htur_1727 family rSAM-partnered candidate RiPP [Haloarculaceae archaeon]
MTSDADGTTPSPTFDAVEAPRGDVGREWELFVREESDEPLRHAGSVSAPSAAVAREQATTLLGWSAEALWLCPADETVRLAAEGSALGDRAPDESGSGDAENGGRSDGAGVDG